MVVNHAANGFFVACEFTVTDGCKLPVIPFRVIKFRVENHNALLEKYLPTYQRAVFMRTDINAFVAGG